MATRHSSIYGRPDLDKIDIIANSRVVNNIASLTVQAGALAVTGTPSNAVLVIPSGPTLGNVPNATTFQGNLTAEGNTVIGNEGGDNLTISSSQITSANIPVGTPATNGVFFTVNSSNEIVRGTSPSFDGNTLTFNAGQGVEFETANLLDDYEEGTWTPDPNTFISGAQDGTYTKIGQEVTICFRLLNDSTRFINEDLAVRIGNLPFNGQGSAVDHAGDAFYIAGPTDNNNLLYSQFNVKIRLSTGNELSFFDPRDAGTEWRDIAIQPSVPGSSIPSEIHVTFTYFTND